MNPNESRRARKKLKQATENTSNNSINNKYYIAIGILAVILILLIIYVFNRDQSADNANLDTDNSQSELVNESNISEGTESEEISNNEDSVEDTTTEESTESDNEDESGSEEVIEEEVDADEEESESDLSLAVGESEVIDGSAPHDASHVVNYNEGSGDRVAIRNEIIASTGLGSDLIEWWVGQNGSGRVIATVSNPDMTEVYEVFLQYGDGQWSATNIERLAEVPSEYQ